MKATSMLRRLAGRRLLVLGDLMLDEYVWGVAERISPEAPVPVVRAERKTYAPGGAANVVANVQSLGGRALAFGVVGDDGAGQQLRGELQALGADVSGVVTEPKRWTTLKTRVMAQRQQMLRVDHEQSGGIADATVKELLKRVRAALPHCDGVVFSDYGKGVLRRSLVSHVIAEAAKLQKPTLAGPKPDSLSRFAGAMFLSFNRSEAALAIHARTLPNDMVDDAGKQLLNDLNVSAIAITLSADGVALFVRGEKPRRFPARSIEVFDVAGAGDTFLAGTALALAARAKFTDAVQFGNLAAAAAVRKVGVVAVTAHDIEQLK